MSAIEDLEPDGEPLDEAGSLLLQVVAAVDYLRRGIRPGFTVWDAFEEALRWQAGIDHDWAVDDPLLCSIRLTFPSTNTIKASEKLNAATRHWVRTTSAVFNASTDWELSIARRSLL